MNIEQLKREIEELKKVELLAVIEGDRESAKLTNEVRKQDERILAILEEFEARKSSNK